MSSKHAAESKTPEASSTQDSLSLSASKTPEASSTQAGSTKRALGSLVFRLTALYTVSASVLVTLVALVLYAELVRDVDREDDTLLRENALLIDALLMHPTTDPKQSLLDMQNGRMLLGSQEVAFRILDGNGAVQVETPNMAAELVPRAFPEAVDPTNGGARGEDRARGAHLHRLFSATLQSEVLGGKDAYLQLALDRDSEQDLLARYRSLLLLVTIPSLLACAFLGQRIARRAIAPIQTLSARMARIQVASLDERVPSADLVTELRPLIASFNELLARLQASFRQLQRFSSNLAHELRTPINNLCGEIEVALAQPDGRADLQEVLRSCREEALSLSRIIDSLLFLAYAELPGARIVRQPLDVGEEVAGIVDFYEPVAAEAGVRLVAHTEQGAMLAADRTMLQRALANLLTNAIAFTPPGGGITVTLRRAHGGIEIEVADTGRGIKRELANGLLASPYSFRTDDAGHSVRTGLGI